MLTPQQKQRILTAFGWSLEETAWGYDLCDKSGEAIIKKGAAYPTELAAWDSWEPDGNFIKEQLKPFVREFSRPEQERFNHIFEDIVMKFRFPCFIDAWLLEDPEFCCTAFNQLLLEREGK